LARDAALPGHRRVAPKTRDRGRDGTAGIEGFGAKAHLHTTRILQLSQDLPVLIEVVDQEDRIRAVLPELDAMVNDGLITLEHVEVIAYRGGPPSG
jgi:PII-like signaling protein